jgi:broad specificity phosphatase PhoE
MSLYMMRHGESYGNISDHSWEHPSFNFLTLRGQEQATSAAYLLKEKAKPIDIIFASTVMRAHHTARIVADIIGVDLGDVLTTPALDEVYHSGPHTLSENPDKIKMRFRDGDNFLFDRMLEAGKTILLISHALLMRHYLAHHCGLPLVGPDRTHIEHCTPYEMMVHEGKRTGCYQILN